MVVMLHSALFTAGSTCTCMNPCGLSWFPDMPSFGTGTGLDFSAASAVVFAELPDEVSTVRQAEDRAHRQGQTRPVNVYFLLSKATCDERRWAQPLPLAFCLHEWTK